MNKVHSYLRELEAEDLIAVKKYKEALDLLLEALKENDFINKESVFSNISICYLYFQDFKNARSYLEKLISINPDNVTGLYNLGFCCLSLKLYREAIGHFEKLKSKKEFSFDLSYNLGFAYLGINEIIKAMENFHSLITHQTPPELIYNIGISLIHFKFSSEARDYFIKYLSLRNNDIDATFGLGIAYSQLQEFRKAIECFQRVIGWDGKRYISAYVSLSVAYLEIGNGGKALEFLNTAVEIDPLMPEAWYYLGVVYESMEQMSRALDAYKKAGDLNHAMPDVWEKLGNLNLKLGNRNEARISFKKAFKLTCNDESRGQKNTEYAYKIGLLFMAEKEYQYALDYFLLCLEKLKLSIKNSFIEISNKQGFKDIYENLAICYYYKEEYLNAIEYSKIVIEKDKYNAFIYYITGCSYMKLDNILKAREYLTLGLEISPEDINILYSIGILEGYEERFEEAERFLNKALIIQRSPDIIYALALTKIKLNEISSAVVLLSEYQKYFRNNPEILYKLGLMFIELHHYGEAKNAFQEVLVIHPDNKKAMEYINYLKDQ